MALNVQHCREGGEAGFAQAGRWVWAEAEKKTKQKRGSTFGNRLLICTFGQKGESTRAAGIFSRRTNQTQEARVYSHEGPIGHSFRPYPGGFELLSELSQHALRPLHLRKGAGGTHR
eukprot:1190782-Prorocentrum_minimum.AAC.1